jgi:hypothetical protein
MKETHRKDQCAMESTGPKKWWNFFSEKGLGPDEHPEYYVSHDYFWRPAKINNLLNFVFRDDFQPYTLRDQAGHSNWRQKEKFGQCEMFDLKRALKTYNILIIAVILLCFFKQYMASMMVALLFILYRYMFFSFALMW